MISRFLSHLSVKHLSGVGNVLEAKLNNLGIYTAQDLLFHFPFRYEDHVSTHKINDVTVGQHTTIKGTIIKTEVMNHGRRRMFICYIQDDTGVALLRFMNVTPGIKASLVENQLISAYGEIKRGKYHIEIIHPQFKVAHSSSKLASESIEKDAKFSAIYPTTHGLPQHVLRRLIDSALLMLNAHSPIEIFPSSFAQHWPSATCALEMIHHPTIEMDVEPLISGEHIAVQRFIFEELLAYHLSMVMIKKSNQKQKAYALSPSYHYQTPFLSSLPFNPTDAQLRAWNDIAQDMAKDRPMMRLIQGDVGSGKTLVAALAVLNAIENHKQAVIMAPTEILAEQHWNNFKKWFAPLGITVGFLSSHLSKKEKVQTYSDLLNGHIRLLIGTHAVFVDKVEFVELGLVVIDEQHRFGVNQRLNLWQKGLKNQFYPHQLIMTATPIPRTLAMTIYADLDVSIIDELPPGRTPVQTIVIPNSRRDEVIKRVDHACQNRRQVYWVCTLVEESEMLDAQAAEILVEELRALLPQLSIGLVHGRMKAADKQTVMEQFKSGDIQLLVATTVIEVGVDIPNASLMIIENAERLGLAQLHQLRGRVGRGAVNSHCVLMYQSPLSYIAQQRMQVMRDTNDGFIIAQKDLDIRGSGEILGTRQMGIANFKIVNLIRDQHLIAEVQNMAKYLAQHHPDTVQQLIATWLPDREKYINA